MLATDEVLSCIKDDATPTILSLSRFVILQESRQLVFSAARSRDPDDLSNRVPFSYSWACTASDGEVRRHPSFAAAEIVQPVTWPCQPSSIYAHML